MDAVVLTGARERRVRVSRRLVLAGVVLAVALAPLAVWLGGVRWFVVETASMGRSAPVGSLVVTRAVPAAERITPGQIVTFRPPGDAGSTVYTHRVRAVDADTIRTGGDLNSDPDPWTVRRSDLVGTAVGVVPGGGAALGFLSVLARGAPLLLIATAPVRVPLLRTGLRVLGRAVVAAIDLRLHPLVGATVLGATPDAAGHGLLVRVVSTGLLPLRVGAEAGAGRLLQSGETATLHLLRGDAWVLHTTAAPAPWQAGLLAACCLLPAAAAAMVAIRSGRRRA